MGWRFVLCFQGCIVQYLFICLFIWFMSLNAKKEFALVCNARELETGHFFLTKNEDGKDRTRV